MTTETINQIFEDALLSEAAYADLTDLNVTSDPAVLRAKLLAQGIAASAAEYISQNYRVVNHRPDTPSGYSATLFQRADNPDTPEMEEGFVFAQRGTVPGDLPDIEAGIQIAFQGFARDQINDMHDYWQWIGTNVFEGSPPPIRVTGHSLGGHLATVFALGSAQIEHASTFNGAGIANVVPTSAVPAGLSSFVLEAFARQTGYSGTIPNSDVSNIQAAAGLEIVAGVNTLIGSVDPVFSEGIINPVNTVRLHQIKNLTASLALHRAFSLIDSDASIADIGRFLEGATNVTTESYERAAEMLVRTIQALDPAFSAPRRQRIRRWVRRELRADRTSSARSARRRLRIEPDGTGRLEPARHGNGGGCCARKRRSLCARARPLVRRPRPSLRRRVRSVEFYGGVLRARTRASCTRRVSRP